MITGANGLLGTAFHERFKQTHEVFAYGKEELDVTNPLQVSLVVKKIRPDAIIHCAGYSHMDAAETERDQAFRINALGTRNVAIAAQRVGAKFVYPSTGYVFDGRKMKPYTEDDVPNPLSIYGKTKLSGEKYVTELCKKHFIVRSSWVYGQFGHDFVKRVLELAKDQGHLLVVDDQIGSPTHAMDIAQFVLGLLETDKYGSYHASSSGQCTWYEFAQKIVELAEIKDVNVQPCTTKEVDQAALRSKTVLLGSIRTHIAESMQIGEWQARLSFFLADKQPLRAVVAYA